MHIKKGDTVRIITGKDRGKTGKILKLLPEADRVIVEGFNVYKKRVRPKQQGKKGEVVSVARPMHISNMMLVCGSCKKPVRVGHRYEADSKIRYCKQCRAST